jgi:hypothetical protein
MSNWNYCHGPNCHTYHTQSRIRGVKGNKVLRTRKITQTKWNENTWFGYFCDERCRTDYMHKHLNSIMQHEPRSEPLETSIELETVEDTDWRGNPYTYKKIVEANQ